MDYDKLRSIVKATKNLDGKELLKFPLYFIPGVGTALMARDAVKDFRSGNYGSGLLNTGFAAMGLGAVGKALKGVAGVGNKVGINGLKQTIPAAQKFIPMLPEAKVHNLLPQAEYGIIPYVKRTNLLPQSEYAIVPIFNRAKTISPITIEPRVQLISAVPKKPRSSWFRNFMNNAEDVTFVARKGCKLNKSKSK